MSLFEIFKKKSENQTEIKEQSLPSHTPNGSYINQFNRDEEINGLSENECAFSWRVNADDGSVDERVKVDYSKIQFPKYLWIDDFSKVEFPSNLRMAEKIKKS